MEIDLQRQRFERYVAGSFILHILLFLSLGVGSLFSPKTIKMEPTVLVDIVALPTQLKNSDQPPPDTTLPPKPNVQPPPPPEPKPEPEQVAKPEPKAPPQDDEMALERKKEADAKKRAEAALKHMREQLKKEKQAQEEKRKEDLAAFEQKYRQAIAGNQKNDGTSLTGQMKATLNAYVAAITDQIRSHWALPSFLQDQQLKAYIVIHIGSQGNVVSMEFSRVSGNKLFDDYAEKAIRTSSPLPPPPAEMASGLRNSGVEVKFPL
jgi:TonB family protein